MKTTRTKTAAHKTYIGKALALLAFISFSAFIISETSPFKTVGSSNLKVIGTSNIHDWTMNASGFSCEGTLVLNGEQLADITALNFSLPVANLKGKEDLLNSRAHKALKAEQHNRITFKLTEATVVPQQKVVKAVGNLTIGGVTKPLSLQTSYTVNGDEVTFKGSKDIKMSEYGIKPPSFMMGALKVADQVTIDINLKVKN